MNDFYKAIELKNFNAYNTRGVLKNRMADYRSVLDDFNLAEQNYAGIKRIFCTTVELRVKYCQ